MLSDVQKLIIVFWVGTPIVTMLFWNFINPGYMEGFFEPIGSFSAPIFVIAVQNINFVILVLGFRAANRSQRRATRTRLLAIITLLIITLPSLLLVLLLSAIRKVAGFMQ